MNKMLIKLLAYSYYLDIWLVRTESRGRPYVGIKSILFSIAPDEGA